MAAPDPSPQTLDAPDATIGRPLQPEAGPVVARQSATTSGARGGAVRRWLRSLLRPAKTPRSELRTLSARERADEAFGWYARHARRARRAYQLSELALLIAGALVPVSTVVTSNPLAPSLLGAAVVGLTGARRIFNNNENWIRFTDACVQLETACRFYDHRIDPYHDEATRDVRLIQEVRRIETEETRGWGELRASDRPSAAS